MSSQLDKGPQSRLPRLTCRRAMIGIALLAVIFTAVAAYSKHFSLESVRRKCIATFDLASRCDCIVREIGTNTYAISFVPMFKILSGLSQQKLAGIIREAAMACAEPR
jgi:hypothetical protein